MNLHVLVSTRLTNSGVCNTMEHPNYIVHFMILYNYAVTVQLVQFIVIETEQGKTHFWACLVQLSYRFLCAGDSNFGGLIYMYVRDFLGGVEFLGIYSGVQRRLFTEFHNNLFCQMIVPVLYCQCCLSPFKILFLPGLHSLFKLGILCILSKLTLDSESSLPLLSFSLDFSCGFCHILVPGLMHLPSLSLVSIIRKKPLQSKCLFFNFVLATTACKQSKQF